MNFARLQRDSDSNRLERQKLPTAPIGVRRSAEGSRDKGAAEPTAADELIKLVKSAALGTFGELLARERARARLGS